MSELKLSGKIVKIHKEEQVTDSFKKRLLWLDTGGDYPQQVELQFVQDKCSLLDDFSQDDKVEVDFNVRGKGYRNKEGEARVFTNLQGWRIKKLDGQSEPEPSQPTSSKNDDLPF